MQDRFIALHMLKPTIEGWGEARFSIGHDSVSQRDWARRAGWNEQDLSAILLAQIEEHGAEIFYNHDPLRFGSDFVRRLPGCVKKTVAWRAAPSPGSDFGAYDYVVCNFPSILANYERQGWSARYFFPSVDPAMYEFGDNMDRPLDVIFVGTYSRHHKNRSQTIEQLAKLPSRYKIQINLLQSLPTRVASRLPAFLPIINRYALPDAVKCRAKPPIFGKELYQNLGKAKIVLNGAIDMAGKDRGNMRCFEALGCGAMLLSDKGNYPEGLVDGTTMVAYTDADDAMAKIEQYLDDQQTRQSIADAGCDMVNSLYSKEAQWAAFQQIVG
jgi:glycosyltransferase involved in cell wall biosynthesis